MIEIEEGYCDCGDLDALDKKGTCKEHLRPKRAIEHSEQTSEFKTAMAELLFGLIYYHKYELSIEEAVDDVAKCYFYFLQEMEKHMRSSHLVSSLVAEVLSTPVRMLPAKAVPKKQFKRVSKRIKKTCRQRHLAGNLDKLNFRNSKKKKNQLLSAHFFNPKKLFNSRAKNLNLLNLMLVEEEDSAHFDLIQEDWDFVELIDNFLRGCYGSFQLKKQLALNFLKFYDCYDEHFEGLDNSVFSSAEVMEQVLPRPEVSMAALTCLASVDLFESESALPDIDCLRDVLECFEAFVENIWSSRLSQPRNTLGFVHSENFQVFMEVAVVLEVAINHQFDAIDIVSEDDDEESELEKFFETWTNLVFGLMVGCNNMSPVDRRRTMLRILRQGIRAVVGVEKAMGYSKAKNKDPIYRQLRFNCLLLLVAMAFVNLFALRVEGPLQRLNSRAEIADLKALFGEISDQLQPKDMQQFVQIVIRRVFFNAGRRAGVYRKYFYVNSDENVYFIKDWIVGLARILSILWPEFRETYAREFGTCLNNMRGAEFFERLVQVSVQIFYSKCTLEFLYFGLGMGHDLQVEPDVLDVRLEETLRSAGFMKQIGSLYLQLHSQCKIKDFEELFNYPFEYDNGLLGSRFKNRIIREISDVDEEGFCRLKACAPKSGLKMAMLLFKPNLIRELETKAKERGIDLEQEAGAEALEAGDGADVGRVLVKSFAKIEPILKKMKKKKGKKGKKEDNRDIIVEGVRRGLVLAKEVLELFKIECEPLKKILKRQGQKSELTKVTKENEKKRQKIKKKGKRLMAKIKRKGKKKMAKIKDLKPKTAQDKPQAEGARTLGNCHICHEEMKDESLVCTLVKRHNYDVHAILRDQRVKQVESKHSKKYNSEKAIAPNRGTGSLEKLGRGRDDLYMAGYDPVENLRVKPGWTQTAELGGKKRVALYTTCGHEYHVECVLKTHLEQLDSEGSFMKCSFCQKPSDNYFISNKVDLWTHTEHDLNSFFIEISQESNSCLTLVQTIENCLIQCVFMRRVWDHDLFHRRILPCMQQLMSMVYAFGVQQKPCVSEILQVLVSKISASLFPFAEAEGSAPWERVLRLDCDLEFTRLFVWKFLARVFESGCKKREDLYPLFDQCFYELLPAFSLLRFAQTRVLESSSVPETTPEWSGFGQIFGRFREMGHMLRQALLKDSLADWEVFDGSRLTRSQYRGIRSAEADIRAKRLFGDTEKPLHEKLADR